MRSAESGPQRRPSLRAGEAKRVPSGAWRRRSTSATGFLCVLGIGSLQAPRAVSSATRAADVGDVVTVDTDELPAFELAIEPAHALDQVGQLRAHPIAASASRRPTQNGWVWTKTSITGSRAARSPCAGSTSLDPSRRCRRATEQGRLGHHLLEVAADRHRSDSVVPSSSPSTGSWPEARFPRRKRRRLVAHRVHVEFLDRHVGALLGHGRCARATRVGRVLRL